MKYQTACCGQRDEQKMFRQPCLEFCRDVVRDQAEVYNGLSYGNQWREDGAQDIEEQQQDVDHWKCNIV